MTPSFRLSRRVAGAAVVLIAGACCFLWIERAPLFEWDEARHAVNAWEMRRSQDWFNYTYAGAPDRWNAKPQLLVWLIALGYEVAGAREAAVRWPSAVAAFALILVVYRFARLWFSRRLALVAALCAATMRGLVGYHAGRTGDMDALFTLFLTAASFLLVKAVVGYLRPEQPPRRARAIRYASTSGLLLGLAFLAKGFAVGLAAPGFLCFLLWRRRCLRLSTLAVFCSSAALLPLLWLVAQVRFGLEHAAEQFGGRSQIVTMFVYDVVGRVRGNVDGAPGKADPLFVLRQLDVLASPWGYVFLSGMLALAVRPGYRRRFLTNESLSEPLKVAACFFLPMAVTLTLMRHKLPWYTAPLLPFVVLAVSCVLRSLEIWRFRVAMTAMALVGVFALARQLRYIARPYDPKPRAWFEENAQAIRAAKNLVAASPLHQDEVAYLSWLRPDAKFMVLGGPTESGARSSLILTCGGGEGEGGSQGDCEIRR